MLDMCRSVAESSQACPKMWDVPKLPIVIRKMMASQQILGYPVGYPAFGLTGFPHCCSQDFGIPSQFFWSIGQCHTIPRQDSTRLDKCCKELPIPIAAAPQTPASSQQLRRSHGCCAFHFLALGMKGVLILKNSCELLELHGRIVGIRNSCSVYLYNHITKHTVIELQM